MKGLVIVLLAIIVVLLLVCGAFAFTLLKTDDGGSSLAGKIKNKLNIGSSESSGSGNNIIHDVIKENSQNGGGSYREVTYKDGGFRQYDKDGKLIGSSYESDQGQLPSME